MPAYFTYITPECEKEAKKHSELGEVQKLAEKIDRTQEVGNLSFFPRIFRKKSLGKSYRLIIGEVPYEGDVDARLLIFWHIWPKSSPDYKEFSRDSQSFEDNFRQDCEQLTPSLEEIWKEKLQSAPPEMLPQELSQEEQIFLWGSRSSHHEQGDWIILESETWIERTSPQKSSSQNNLSTRLSDILSIVTQAVQNADNGDCNTTFLEGENNTAILYKALCDEKVLFLIAPLHANNQSDRQELESAYHGVLTATEKSVLKRSSWRSYPSLVLADVDLWEHIQKADEKANLSLSAEEAEVLQQSRNGHYPLFINGRPGSGKSTILQYLFAEHLYDYLPLADALQAPPLYLTYSQDLLETAYKNVKAILTSNAYHRLRDDAPAFEDIDELVRTSFYTLKDYLYGLLPEDKKDELPERGYLRYPEFRLWYEKTLGRDASLAGISAELAWHVIRSYIKGLSSDTGEYLDDIAEFEELPGNKSVTSDTFKSVSQQIWPRYREWCQENAYWDDQDLVRAVLTGWADKDIDVPEHVAVFCDEAQDYSLNELRFIFRLSLYARRRLTPDILNRLPFAFAGDPFQTLNPTGFDWDAIRGNFGITMRELLYARRDHYPIVEPAELTFNYRSSADIVQVCNFIHLIRGLVFRKPGLKPQDTWFREASRTPVYFDVDSEVFRSMIQSQQETVIILPCQEGEEQRFVENDSFLATFGLENGTIARNILSPMRAKGLEYQRVVLYKFGDACRSDYPGLLALLDNGHNGPTDREDSEQLLPLEYFINRLYVAASRARKRLIIVDTIDGLEHFWQKFFEKTDLQRWLNDYRAFDGSDHWQEKHIGKIQPGRLDDWEGDRDDPLTLAEDFESRGIANKDTFLLQRAAQNYRMSGREGYARRCDARRLELEEKFIEAGQIWQDLGEEDRAKSLYWKAQAFDLLAAFNDHSLQQRAAHFMLTRQDTSLQEVRTLLVDIEQGLENHHIEPDKGWRVVISALYQGLLNKSHEEDLQPFEWERLWNRADRLHKKGLLERDEEVVQLHLRATPYPEKLGLLQKYKLPASTMVDLYKQHLAEPLDETQVDIVFQALRTTEDDVALESLVAQYPTEHRFAGMLAYYAQQRKDSARDWGRKMLEYWVQNARWDAALDFVKGKRVKGLVSEHDAKSIRNYQWEKYEMDIPFIRLLSVSDALSQADTAHQNQVSRYLNDRLLKRPDFFSTQLTVQQAGGALERAGKVMDCLEFYEMVFQHQTWPASEEDQQFARQRWLVCKGRQIGITDNDDRKRKIQKEINNRAREWQIDIAKLPTFPVVDVDARPKPVAPKPVERTFSPDDDKTREPSQKANALEDLLPDVKGTKNVDALLQKGNTQQPPVASANEEVDTPVPSPEPAPSLIKLQVMAGPRRFVIQLNRSRGKMTIREADEMEMVTLTAHDLGIQGSDDDFSAQIDTAKKFSSRAEYFVAPWNLTCVMRKTRRNRHIIYVDLFLGRGQSKSELLSLRLAE
ncbi:MAG: hypothetical protein D6694_06325 [Gammaproteobacteria bacterium]|nr:MAG: hypothetical protein D6694_06325 [Gammaproteobacteria bacterium]